MTSSLYKKMKAGYWHVRTAIGWRPQHVVMMEAIVGRTILTGLEDVHHKNCVKTDNRPSNLLLLRNDLHHRLHGRGYTYFDDDKRRGFCVPPKSNWPWYFNFFGQFYPLARNSPGKYVFLTGREANE